MSLFCLPEHVRSTHMGKGKHGGGGGGGGGGGCNGDSLVTSALAPEGVQNPYPSPLLDPSRRLTYEEDRYPTAHRRRGDVRPLRVLNSSLLRSSVSFFRYRLISTLRFASLYFGFISISLWQTDWLDIRCSVEKPAHTGRISVRYALALLPHCSRLSFLSFSLAHSALTFQLFFCLG